MAITDKTGLWKLAAVRMGMAPSIHVLDSATPTTALELTFEQLYDQIRIAQIRSGKLRFARREQVLRLAPTTDYTGASHEWSDIWSYVYAPPVDMVEFLRFDDEVPEAGMASDYQSIALPIAYTEISGATILLYVVSPTTSADHLPAYVYRDWTRGRFFDNDNVEHVIIDKPDAAVDYTFDWKDEASGVTLPGAALQSYLGGMAWSIDYEPGAVAGEYAMSVATAITLEVAYGSPYLDEPLVKWTDHIATHKPDACAVYLVDVTNPALWPVEFQNSVAAEMAYYASITHAKSPRIIAALEREKAIAFSTMVSVWGATEASIDGGGTSRAARARY